jgi:DNA-binding LacI/PurR family transcriptional regulator
MESNTKHALGTARPRRKCAAIADSLRRQIVRGRLAPGSRVPTQAEIKRRHGAAAATVQRVFDVLASDGFIVTKGAAGTIVAPNPPHLCRYGVVFPAGRLGEAPDGTYTATLARLCQLIRDRGERDLALFFDIDAHTDVPDYRRVVHDLRAHRLAGLLLATNPTHPAATSLLALAEDVPCVTIGTGSAEGIPVVTTDRESWQDKAVDYLAERGRKRVASIEIDFDPAWQARLEGRLAKRGLSTRPHWRLQAHAALPVSVRNPVHLLMESAGRPDALLVTDDIFVEDVLLGVYHAGLRIPDDVDVVAHCNFPQARVSAFPVTRLGYSAAAILERAFAVVDLQRQGRKVPMLTRLPAGFEEEFAAAAVGKTAAAA